jgi:preprotein translocase subunit SecE
MATAGADRRQSLVEYFRGVAEELRKVVWPARDELLRMTGIVIATVILFGVLIGGADYLLSLGVRQVYTTKTQTNTTTNNLPPTVTTAPSAKPAATP